MKKIILLCLGALLTLTAHAQLNVLSDFSSFEPTYYGFAGSWSADTALSGPTSFSIANQGAGVPMNDGSFTRWFGSTQDFSSYQYVVLNGTALAGNATSEFSFFVEDADGSSGIATFNMADFASGQSSVNLAGLFAMINPSAIVNWGITTENQMGDKAFAFNFDQIALSPTPIPEPSTYAALAGGMALLGSMVLRRRRA